MCIENGNELFGKVANDDPFELCSFPKVLNKPIKGIIVISL